ncbi:glycosyltransferase family 4 protein [Marinilabilia salmonicolor]|uniref:Colanic acid/amylovoran biosynthesis glycosyltransferase n=1 Tax=Marinilabilia salmonicolor TaxID=989 RepID=A0A368V8R8_9BACT|nr:glycosyltransferase family 4 protein [Marinilabilia salmonicolor]RCW36720.1 colanic acid/amylovoran biosynthesis glycosyltransferase [Marinilabilia salmonicolor]
MKIAIYSGEIPSTSFIENLIKGISEKPGINIVLYGKKKGDVKYNSNIEVHYFPSSFPGTVFQIIRNCILLGLSNPGALRKLFRISSFAGGSVRACLNRLVQRLVVVRNLPDIFHIQWVKEADGWLFLKEEFGVKLIASFRGAHINYSPVADESLAKRYRQSFPRFDAFHSVSSALIGEAQKYGAAPEKVYRITGAVDKGLIVNPQSEKWETTDAVLNILSVGRHHWKKGYHFALDACCLLKKRGVRFKYLIVGGAPGEELLFQQHDLDLKDEVEFLGKIPHDKISGIYEQADVFLLPSVEEGIANVVLEAMALGVPVVSTNCGGMSEVIRSGENGWLVPVRSPEAIAEALSMVVENKALLPEVVKSAQRTIADHFLLSGQIDAFGKMYSEVFYS